MTARCTITRTYPGSDGRPGLTRRCDGPELKDGLCAHHYARKHRPCAEGEHAWNDRDECERCGHLRINAGADPDEERRERRTA